MKTEKFDYSKNTDVNDFDKVQQNLQQELNTFKEKVEQGPKKPKLNFTEGIEQEFKNKLTEETTSNQIDTIMKDYTKKKMGLSEGFSMEDIILQINASKTHDDIDLGNMMSDIDYKYQNQGLKMKMKKGGNIARAIQIYLSKKRYNVKYKYDQQPGKEYDGKLGPETVDAIEIFQNKINDKINSNTKTIKGIIAKIVSSNKNKNITYPTYNVNYQSGHFSISTRKLNQIFYVDLDKGFLKLKTEKGDKIFTFPKNILSFDINGDNGDILPGSNNNIKKFKKILNIINSISVVVYNMSNPTSNSTIDPKHTRNYRPYINEGEEWKRVGVVVDRKGWKGNIKDSLDDTITVMSTKLVNTLGLDSKDLVNFFNDIYEHDFKPEQKEKSLHSATHKKR